MKHIFLTIIFLTLIFLSACEAYLDSKYEKYYLEEELIFQYDSGDVFIYENEKGGLDSLMVYSESQYMYESEDWVKNEHQVYELVNMKGLIFHNAFDTCLSDTWPSHSRVIQCTNEFQGIKIFDVLSVATSDRSTIKESIYNEFQINRYMYGFRNLTEINFRINEKDYNNSLVLPLGEDYQYFLTDSIIFNYMYGIIAYRDIEEGWYKLKTIGELD